MQISKITLSILLFIPLCVNAQKLLYVSGSGSDDVAYENNDIEHPWATPDKAWMNAQAGDTVFFRSGTYQVTQTINTKYAAGSGTEGNPIVFTNYPDESVVIIGDVGGGPIFIIEKNYNQIKGLTIEGGNFSGGSLEGSVIVIGWDLPAEHFKITDSKIKVYQSNTYSNNASIRINSNDAEVSNCLIEGDGGTIGVQIFRSEGLQISNNEFKNCGLGIYFKHSNLLDSDPSLTNYFKNNYFHDLSREAIYGVFNYAIIENNLLVNCGINFGDDGGMGDGYVGADYNTISHNTVYNSTITFVYEGRDEDPNKGCLHNKILDNLVMAKSVYHNYTAIDADIQSNYNLYPNIGKIISENKIEYTLEEWQTKNNTDANSYVGTPQFAGGESPTTIPGYALTDESVGKNSASDGSDVGANIDLVGLSNNGTATGNNSLKLVEDLRVEKIYPNPANNSTEIFVNLLINSDILVDIYDLSGHKVRQLYQGELNSGGHYITWDTNDDNGNLVPNGQYIVRIATNKVFQTEKIVVFR